ncbi:BatA domain-containing protein [Chryseotalea sanaruensis]|nr:BatA domain-containing protein [Chryseotalea sanaruensis]
MTFLYPGFLWALFALAIPLIIHLFNFRRTQKIYFSSTRFIREVQETSSAKRRLKHWLVLASRLLFLFFLVVVFAQPILPAKQQLQAGDHIAIYIDNSLSMSSPTDGASRTFDAALIAARTITDVFPADTRYRLLTNDFEPFANTLKTKAEVQEALAKFRLGSKIRTADEIVSRFNRLGNERDIFWLSDFQQSTFGKTLQPDSSRRFHLVPFQITAKSNIYIDTAFLDNPFAIGGEQNTLSLRLVNDGDADRTQLNVRLVVDGLQVGTTTTDIPANSEKEVSFVLNNNQAGIHQAVISFGDTPITFDNEFYLSLNFANRIKIVQITEQNSSSVVKKIYANNQLFDLINRVGSNIDYSQLAQADLIVLNELERLDQSLLAVLSDFMEAGGTVLLIPAANPDVASYQSLLPSIMVSKQEKLLELTKPDSKNPFFNNVFQEQPSQMAMPLVRNSITWGDDRQAILKQQDDLPYLSLFQQQGRLYVMGGPMQSTHGTFLNHALVVPVMYRIAAFSRRSDKQLYQLLSQNLLSLSADSLNDNQLITLKGETEVTPAQRNVNKQVLIDLAGLDLEPGHYQATIQNDTLSTIAFNMTKSESIMKSLSRNELTDFFGSSADVYDLDSSSSSEIAEVLKENYQGVSLWKYALILSILSVLIEVMLLRFWK